MNITCAAAGTAAQLVNCVMSTGGNNYMITSSSGTNPNYTINFANAVWPEARSRILSISILNLQRVYSGWIILVRVTRDLHLAITTRLEKLT